MIPLLPVLPLLAAALFCMAAIRPLKGSSRGVAGLGVLALLSSAALLLALSGRRGEAFGGLLAADALSLAAGVVILAASAAALLLAPEYLSARRLGATDFTILVLLAASGLMILAMAREILTAVLALETASVSLYAMTGYDRRRASSAEAALKYFLPGAVASALLLYGAACAFGATGATRLGAYPGALGALATGLLLSGLAFKAGLVPFHGWLPDAYAGSPAPAAAFMAAAVKAGAFAALARLAGAGSATFLVLAAVLAMTFGNLAGLAQTGLKRLLAYSAIAHSGYLAVGMAAMARGASAAPVAAYLAVYGLFTVGAFAAAGLMEDPSTGGLEIARMRGLARRRPVLALSLAGCLLGLAGFPPTAGFLAKLDLFSAAWGKGLEGLVVAAVLNSVLALGYYLKPILSMFMEEEPQGAGLPEGGGMGGFLALLAGAGGLALGICPFLWR